MIRDAVVNVVVLVSKEDGSMKVEMVSNIASVNSASELFVVPETKEYAIYSQEFFYDEKHRSRRNNNNMFHPVSKKRMILVGPIWGSAAHNKNSYLELSNSQVTFKSVPIDEI
jgi:hypothetical protein